MITESLVTKILSVLDAGLTRGLGSPEPGKMCVEAAICYALGEPHSDIPSCVSSLVRDFEITLNDQDWPSDKARAEGMKYLAIAQLGSIDISETQFKETLFKISQTEVILPTFDWISNENRIPEHEELKEFVKINTDIRVLRERFKDYDYYSYNSYNSYYHYHSYYYYNYNYYYNYYYYFPRETFHQYLLNIASAGLKTLQTLDSPGCKFLHLVK